MRELIYVIFNIADFGFNISKVKMTKKVVRDLNINTPAYGVWMNLLLLALHVIVSYFTLGLV